jgi:hypothetical protein
MATDLLAISPPIVAEHHNVVTTSRLGAKATERELCAQQ